MNRHRNKDARDERGFMLAALPVVITIAIIIVGVLSAIAVPFYFSQRDKAYDAGAKQTARTAALVLETWATEHVDGYDRASLAILPQTDETLSEGGVTLMYTSATGYELSVHSESGNTFDIARDVNGTMDFGCSAVGEAGCPTSGSWN